MPARPAPEPTVHLTLRWRHDVLAVRRAGAEGVPVGALAPIPCAPSLLGFVFARVEGGAPTASAPPGGVATLWRHDGAVEIVEGPASIRLGAGDVAELSLGDFVLAASAGAPDALPRARRRVAAAWGVALAALAHALVLGLAAVDARAAMADDREEAQIEALRGLLASAERRARAETPPIEDGAGRGEGREQDRRQGDGRAGGGAGAEGEEGKMGDRLARPGEARRYAVREELKRDPSPEAGRAAAVADAATFGMIGLLAQGSAGPSADFADAWAHGADPVDANGAMWARAIGPEGGAAGLGLSGIGESCGGCRGEGIGLGRIGTLGHAGGPAGPGLGGAGSPMPGISGWSEWGDIGLSGHGVGHVGRMGHVTRAYTCRLCYDAALISGRLPPETIQRIVRQNFGRFRACYEAGLTRNPSLAGTVRARFVIGRDGAVSNVGDGGSSMPDPAVTSCVIRAFYGLSFPQPEGGIVTVVYPIAFSPAS